VDPARDLGRVDVWEQSLKRSLERRGRPRRSSVELYRLRPARDLTLEDVLERSSHYSELRRRAAQRSAMPRPSVAIGGISALALVAGSTLPSLLGGGRAAKKERVTYAAAAHTQARAEAAVGGSWTGSGQRKATQASAQRRAARTTAGKAVSHAARGSSSAAVSSSGGVGLASASGKTSQARIKLVSDHTSTVQPVVASVRQVQQRLGIDPVDGSYGAVTEQAVSQFQSTHGLQANGVVGDATRRALGLGPGPTLHPEAAATEAPAPAVAAPTATQERTASPNNAVHDTGGVPMGPAQTHPVAPTHVTTPTTETVPSSTQSGPTGSVQSGIQRMVAAGNRIATRPYVYGGGHGSFNSRGYDCSGSVSYVLHAAGLLRSPEDSTELESYGRAGPGRYVTIYANSGHAFMTIQGRRFDTVAQGQTGSRWSKHMVSTGGFVARHPTHY
jgi:peptidoglycan hydrolase-like protein with peptidoglycan-binding domain